MYTFQKAMAILERFSSAHLREENINLRIPTSDKLHELYLNEIVPSENEQLAYIRILVESHHLFTDEIEKGSQLPLIRYIIADLSIIRKLKDWASKTLEEKFERRFYRRYHINKIIAEIVNNPEQSRGSEIGVLLDIILLLSRCEQWIVANSKSYSPLWKQEKLKELLEIHNRNGNEETQGTIEKGKLVADAAGGGHRSARTTRISMIEKSLDKLQKEEESDPWSSLRKSCGLENLINIHLRKREFTTLLSLLAKGSIAQEGHLRYLKSALGELMEEILYDTELQQHEDRIIQLRRVIQVRLNNIQTLKKELQALRDAEEEELSRSQPTATEQSRENALSNASMFPEAAKQPPK